MNFIEEVDLIVKGLPLRLPRICRRDGEKRCRRDELIGLESGDKDGLLTGDEVELSKFDSALRGQDTEEELSVRKGVRLVHGGGSWGESVVEDS